MEGLARTAGAGVLDDAAEVPRSQPGPALPLLQGPVPGAVLAGGRAAMKTPTFALIVLAILFVFAAGLLAGMMLP